MTTAETCTDCGSPDLKPKRRQCARCVYLRKKAAVEAWRAKNPDRVRELGRSSRYKRYGPSRDAAIEYLGGKCSGCGFTDQRCLDVDHTFGGGDKERARKDRITFYKEVLAGQRDDVQVLCLNCHRIKSCEERHVS